PDRRRLGVNTDRAAALRNLPTVLIDWKAVLADKESIAVRIDGHDADGAILEVDGAVHPGRPGRRQDVIVRDANPPIVVHHLTRADGPRIGCGISHVYYPQAPPR